MLDLRKKEAYMNPHSLVTNSRGKNKRKHHLTNFKQVNKKRKKMNIT